MRKQRTDQPSKSMSRYCLDADVLEKRLLFSATPAGPVVTSEVTIDHDVELSSTFQHNDPDVEAADSSIVEIDEQFHQHARLELVFVDAGVEDLGQLVAGLRAENSTTELEIYLLDAERDGIEQISEILAVYRDVDAVHIFSHGNDGLLRLGNATVAAGNLSGYAADLAGWQSSLAAEADLLLYGCQLAGTDAGVAMLESFAALTGADVAGSVDDTGHASLGGDWDLEFTTGVLETDSIFSRPSAPNWLGILSTPQIVPTSETLVNETTSGTQSTANGAQSVAVDGAGNSVVVWEDQTGADGGGSGIFARRYNDQGDPISSEFQVNVTTAGNQTAPMVAMDDSGRFVIAWVSSDGDGDGIYLRRFAADGTAIDTADVLANESRTQGNQNDFDLATNDSGQAVLAFRHEGGGDGVWARTFDFMTAVPSNELATDVVQVEINGTAAGVAVDINNIGRIVIAYEDGGTLFARSYDYVALDPVGSAYALNLDTTNERQIDVAVRSDSSYVVVFRSDVGGSEGVWVRWIDVTGPDVAKPATKVSSGTSALAPKIDIDENDDFVVTYQQDDADGAGVYLQAYMSDMTKFDGETIVNTTTTGQQIGPSIAIHDYQNGIVVWNGNGNQSGQIDADGVFMRQFGLATPNVAPVADLSAGAPYTFSEGGALSLDGSDSSDGNGDTLTYAWDLDNDGIFGETNEPTTATAVIDWATLQSFGMDDDGTYTIGLRVDDGKGGNSTQTTTVTVNNTAPNLSVSGNSAVVAGALYALNLTATDPGDDTLSAWRVDWGDGTIELFAGSATSATHTYNVAGLTHNILVSATDEDGKWLEGDLFLGTGNSNPVYRYDVQTGTFETGVGNSATLNGASSMVIGPDGLLYVTGKFSDNIERFDPTSGSFISEFVSSGSGGLNTPSGLAFGPDGHLYVSSRSTNEILRYDGSSGAFIDVFVSAGLGGLNRPNDIRFGADGNLYVASEFTDNILRFSGATGAYIDEFVAAGAGGLNGPTGLAIGRDGHLYVTSANSNQVLKFDGTSGASLGTFISSGLSGPAGLHWGPDDHLYVVSNLSGELTRYDTSGTYVDTVVESADGVSNPEGLAFSPSHQVSVTVSNTVPSATNVNQTKNYTEGDAVVALDDIVVVDTDPGETITATLTLSLPAAGGLTTGTFGTATSAYNGVTGVWQVSGTVVDVNSALADVAFTPATNHDVDSKIVVHIEDSVGAAPTDGTITLSVTPINDPPLIDLDLDNSSGAIGTAFNAAFVEGMGPVLIADSTDAVITDVDNTTLTALDVTITNLLDGADEILTANTSGTSIVASFAGGVLSLSGTDTVANYQQVLRTIRYENTSATPNSTTRTIELVASDGAASSNMATASVTVSATNNAPTLDLDANDSSGATGPDFNATFVEGGGDVLVADAADAVLADVDSANLTSLTVTITNLLDGGNEILSADTTGTSIAASYAGGVLTLSGSDSAGNYQQVLRTIRYNNTSGTPNITTRFIEFVANDGAASSNTATASVSVSATNNMPVLDLDANDSSGAAGADFNATFVEGGGAILISDATDATLTDIDSPNLSSLTVTITNLLDGLAESLFADTSGTSITANYTAGTLTLSGVESVASYQQVLRTIRYNNPSLLINTTPRVIQFVANDGVSSSPVATANVFITAVNNPPSIDLDTDDSSGVSGSGFQTSFVEGAGPTLVADVSDAVLSDVDSANLTSLTVTISNQLDGAAESLSADTTGTSISASFAGGTLMLSGADTVANYQQVLRTVRYSNNSLNPNTTDRLIQWVANDGGSNSNVATTTIAINAVNNPPSIVVPGTQTPSEDTPWVISGINVSDPDIGSGNFIVTFDVSRGQLTIDPTIGGGIAAGEITGNNSQSITVTTSLARLNNTLAASTGLTYQGNPNVAGADLLVIRVNDMLVTTTANVSINVVPVNDVPVAVNDFYSMDPDGTLTVSAGGLVANDADFDGNPISVVPVSGPSSGTLTLGADGSFQYTPIAGFSGFVTFSYAVSDGSSTSAPATVVIEVNLPINSADIASANKQPEPDTDADPVPEEPQLEEESEEDEVDEELLLAEQPRSESQVDVPLVFASRGIIQSGEDAILTLSAMPQRLVSLTDDESEGECSASSSNSFNERVARERRMETSRSVISILGIAKFDSKMLWDDMEDLAETLNEGQDTPYIFAGTFAGVSSALSVGYVMWTVRGGLLATSLLAHLPAWSFVDPLLVLNELDDQDEEDDDSLEGMLDKGGASEKRDAAMDQSSAAVPALKAPGV